MPASLQIAGKTDMGRKRKNNEDTFLIDPKIGFMVVADGMGGHASGEVASRLATQLCSEQLRLALQTGRVPAVASHVPEMSGFDPRSLILGDCIKFSNAAVYEAGQKNPENRNMGTTIVSALWLEKKVTVAHVGDSRMYLVRGDQIIQCTTDHSFVQEQVDRGLMKPEDAEKSDMKNLLTRSVGIKSDVDVSINEMSLHNGDYLLLCSDGLTKMLSDEQILAVFTEHKQPQIIVEQLIDRANAAGGNDNVTAVVAKVNLPETWDTITDALRNIFTKTS